jgi:cytochrome c-type biogenesis protein CcmF
VDAARRAAYALFALLLICVIAIEVAFISSDFSLSVVANHSSRETPLFYKVTAMWSSQEGSLLLWAFILSLVASVSLYFTREKLRDIVPWAAAIMMGVAVFFTSLMLFGGNVNPFDTLKEVPANGVGLNPLLQHPSMIIHPPMLYVGYVSLTVPFAFAIGALIVRRIDAAWIKSTRGFALIAWTFLSIGIILGARWSYTELGWGGYWAWDPVENASVMPWLITTAYIHSIMVQEKRGMLKVWNVSLIVASFTLALLGTFLVRSGVLQSIHAFGDSTVGPYFLGLITLVLVGSTALIISRLPLLRSDKRIDSMASRESVFLINNLLLVSMCVLVFWGTFFPLISELFTGTESVLAAPWFDRYTTPLAVLLVLFTGIGPLLGAGSPGPESSGSSRSRPPPRWSPSSCCCSSPMPPTVSGRWPCSCSPPSRSWHSPRRRGAGQPPAVRVREVRFRLRSSRWRPATGVATAATSSTSAS